MFKNAWTAETVKAQFAMTADISRLIFASLKGIWMRNEWKFEYKIADLEAGVGKTIRDIEKQIKKCEADQAKYEKKAKHEACPEYGLSKSGRKAEEAEDLAKSHRKKVIELTTWMDIFKNEDENRVMELQLDDIKFFELV